MCVKEGMFRKSGKLPAPWGEADGFTLLETLIVLLILSFGLMAAGQLIYLAIGSASLAGAKGSAALVADSKLAFLVDLYRRDGNAVALCLGTHGPERIQVWNPKTHGVLNRFDITWIIEQVPDPRPGKTIPARRIRVEVVPIDASGNPHFVPLMNKIVTISSVISWRPS
jgi:prepilin-type N-terminal cleavage/methylation domain-containing protein